MLPPTRVLMFDAPTAAVAALRHRLASAGHEISGPHEPERALDLLPSSGADVIIAGLAAAGVAGLARIAAASSDAQLVIAADDANAAEARRALRVGAFGMVQPSDDADTVLHVVDGAARLAQLSREVAALRARVGDRTSASLIGRSPAMDRVRELVGRAAASDMTVLITGEAGTGKDLVARLVHDLSARSARPFVMVRCHDVDATTVETELFGTPATKASVGRVGLLEQARGGTLLLDGYAALPRPLKVRIADVMTTRTVERRTTGSVRQVPVDVRFLLAGRDEAGGGPCCTRDDDQLRRFGVLPIALPPLRERRRDILLLAEHFRARHAGAGSAVDLSDLPSLIGGDWAGNVRELEHFVERRVYQPAVTSPSARTTRPADDLLHDEPTLDAVERRYILRVLEAVGGNQSRAADRLGIDRRTLYRKLKEYREARTEVRLAT